MRKPTFAKEPVAMPGGEKPPLPETKLLGKLPALLSHLSDVQYDDGTARTPGTMMLRKYGSGWTIILKEPDAQAQLLISAPTIDELFKATNDYLSAENAPWERDPYARDVKKSRK